MLFAPQAYGDGGADLIRHIEVDAAGAVYYSTYQNIYVVQPGGGAPELVAERPAGSAPIYGEFWLDGGDLLFPSSDSTSISDTSMDVLYALNLDGQDQRVLLSTPTADPLDFYYGVTNAVARVGDELLWVEQTAARESTGLGESTYRAKRQNFRSAAEAVVWHEANGAINPILVAGDVAFIGVSLDERAGSDEQRIVRFADGSVEPMTAEARFGGEVLAADDASVIVSKLEGIFRYALDGSGEQRIADFVTARQNITSQSGQWAYTDYDYQTQTENVYVYEVGSAPRRLGCIDARGATVHALALTDSSVLVSRYRDSAATLVRFDL